MRVPLFGQQHVDRYRETGGEEGHDWQAGRLGGSAVSFLVRLHRAREAALR